MKEDTKACNLTEDEITALIMLIAREIDDANLQDNLERINYLNGRLKAFKKSGAYANGTEVASQTEATASNEGWK